MTYILYIIMFDVIAARHTASRSNNIITRI